MEHILEEEVYAVDVDAHRRLVLCGGKADSWSVISLDTGDTLFHMGGYSDSIVFSRFVGEDIIVATLNGELYKYDQCYVEKARFELTEDISYIELREEVLYVAGCRAYALDTSLCMQREFFGHTCMIRNIFIYKDEVYTSSQDMIIVHKETSIAKIPVKSGGVIHVNENGIMCAQIDENLVGFFFQMKKLKVISVDGCVEAVTTIGNSFVLGGAFKHLLFVNTMANFCMNKVNAADGVSQIKVVSNALVFSTFDGKIGHLRPGDVVRSVKASVGAIFDFYTDGSTIVVGGENGLDILLAQSLFDGYAAD